MKRSFLPATFQTVTSAAVLVVILASCTVDANVGDVGAEEPWAGDAGTEDASDSKILPGTKPDASDGSSDRPTGGDGGVTSCGLAFAQEGDWVHLEVVEEVSPFGDGGDIVPGVYVLTAIRSYLSGPTGTAEVRETLEVKGSPSVGTFASLE